MICVLYFQEHETARIKCIVNGSNPEPMARIQIGDRKITKKEGLVIKPPKKYDISDRDEYRIGLVKVYTACSFFLPEYRGCEGLIAQNQFLTTVVDVKCST